MRLLFAAANWRPPGPGGRPLDSCCRPVGPARRRAAAGRPLRLIADASSLRNVGGSLFCGGLPPALRLTAASGWVNCGSLRAAAMLEIGAENSILTKSHIFRLICQKTAGKICQTGIF